MSDMSSGPLGRSVSKVHANSSSGSGKLCLADGPIPRRTERSFHIRSGKKNRNSGRTTKVNCYAFESAETARIFPSVRSKTTTVSSNQQKCSRLNVPRRDSRGPTELCARVSSAYAAMMKARSRAPTTGCATRDFFTGFLRTSRRAVVSAETHAPGTRSPIPQAARYKIRT